MKRTTISFDWFLVGFIYTFGGFICTSPCWLSVTSSTALLQCILSIFPASVHQFNANLLVFVNINPFLYIKDQFALGTESQLGEVQLKPPTIIRFPEEGICESFNLVNRSRRAKQRWAKVDATLFSNFQQNVGLRPLKWLTGRPKGCDLLSLLICTLIYQNQGLEESRSISNPRKISGSANLDFFFWSPPWKKLGL